jgi:hypothetical protein
MSLTERVLAFLARWYSENPHNLKPKKETIN